MSRRVSLPGADELFRSTGDAPVGRSEGRPRVVEAVPDAEAMAEPQPVRRTRPAPSAPVDRRPTGREKHEQKITVYCSEDELLDLEQARLGLRRGHGIAVDRGRIVREAISLVIADLEAKGEDSILVRRLRGQ